MTTETDNRFQKAIDTKDFADALQLVKCFPSEEKWNKLLSVAIRDQKWNLAGECQHEITGKKQHVKIPFLTFPACF